MELQSFCGVQIELKTCREHNEATNSPEFDHECEPDVPECQHYTHDGYCAISFDRLCNLTERRSTE